MSETEEPFGDLIASAIEGAYGERCKKFVEGCAVCEAWRQYDNVINVLMAIRDYPRKGLDLRRTDDGFPMEIAYDEWAYRRMVGNYREAAAAGLSHIAPSPKSPKKKRQPEAAE